MEGRARPGWIPQTYQALFLLKTGTVHGFNSGPQNHPKFKYFILFSCGQYIRKTKPKQAEIAI